MIISELQTTEYYPSEKYSDKYPEELGLSAEEEPRLYDKAVCLDHCFEKEWNKQKSDCPFNKPSFEKDAFPEGWQGNASKPDGSDCDAVLTADGRHILLPSAMPCQIKFPACFTSSKAENLKNDISKKCLTLCKQSNYEEKFSFDFDILDDKGMAQSPFQKYRLANKTGIRTEMRYEHRLLVGIVSFTIQQYIKNSLK